MCKKIMGNCERFLHPQQNAMTNKEHCMLIVHLVPQKYGLAPTFGKELGFKKK